MYVKFRTQNTTNYKCSTSSGYLLYSFPFSSFLSLHLRYRFLTPGQSSARLFLSLLAIRFPTQSPLLYKNNTSSYFSAFENELRPKTEDVALIFSTLKRLTRVAKVQLAIRGGGHTPFAGSANINRGVTIDMRSMRGIDVSHNRTLTSIEPASVGAMFKENLMLWVCLSVVDGFQNQEWPG